MRRTHLTDQQWAFNEPLFSRSPHLLTSRAQSRWGTSREGGGRGGGRGAVSATQRERERLRAAPAYSWGTSFQWPSEMTSTAPSTTLMAV